MIYKRDSVQKVNTHYLRRDNNNNPLSHLAAIGNAFGYGRNRFYQWCRIRGLLTHLNAPTSEMVEAGYMVATFSQTGYVRAFVTPAGIAHIRKMFQADVNNGMVKLKEQS